MDRQAFKNLINALGVMGLRTMPFIPGDGGGDFKGALKGEDR